MDKDLNYEKLLKSLIKSVTVFEREPSIILEIDEENSIVIFKKRNITVKNMNSGIMNEQKWERLYFSVFKALTNS